MRIRYISLTGTQYTFPVRINKSTIWISFKGNENDFVTCDKKVQDAIESSNMFISNKIGRVDGPILEGNKNTLDEKSDLKEFKDITDINEAAAILSEDPYNLPEKKLKTPDDIKIAMEAYNISFPNLNF